MCFCANPCEWAFGSFAVGMVFSVFWGSGLLYEYPRRGSGCGNISLRRRLDVLRMPLALHIRSMFMDVQFLTHAALLVEDCVKRVKTLRRG